MPFHVCVAGAPKETTRTVALPRGLHTTVPELLRRVCEAVGVSPFASQLSLVYTTHTLTARSCGAISQYSLQDGSTLVLLFPLVVVRRQGVIRSAFHTKGRDGPFSAACTEQEQPSKGLEAERDALGEEESPRSKILTRAAFPGQSVTQRERKCAKVAVLSLFSCEFGCLCPQHFF